MADSPVAAQLQLPGKPRTPDAAQSSAAAAPSWLFQAGITRLCRPWCCQKAQPAVPQLAAHRASPTAGTAVSSASLSWSLARAGEVLNEELGIPRSEEKECPV